MYDRMENEGIKLVKYQKQSAVIEIERREC